MKVIIYPIFFLILISCSKQTILLPQNNKVLKPSEIKQPLKLSNVNHIIHMGQSLAAGEQSLPIISTNESIYGNLMFKIGTHTWNNSYFPDQPELRNDSLFEFVKLKAVKRFEEGETIANGVSDHFTKGLNSEYKLLFSYSGQGGRYLRELDKIHDDAKDTRAGSRQSKGGYYKTSVNDILRAKNLSEQKNLSYRVLAITWMQGEANGQLTLNRWDKSLNREEFLNNYSNDLIQLKNDLQNDISEIVGQKSTTPFFTYQTGSIAGVAQSIAAKKDNDIYLVGPTYMLPNAENSNFLYNDMVRHGDGIHLTADGERWLGEQFGKVIKRVLIDDEDWKPLQPNNAILLDSLTVKLTFDVPKPPLVIDSLFLPKQGENYGFRINNTDNIPLILNSVYQDSENSIILKSSSAIKDNFTISYGTRPFVKDLDSHKVLEFKRIGLNSHNHEEVKIILSGNCLLDPDVSKLLEEGVFYLNTRVQNNIEDFSNLIIRKVFLNEEGNTAFIGEIKDLYKEKEFKIGQYCYLDRRYSFGNLRDSDDEKSIYKFSDSTYGKRFGMNYPLWNWCIMFEKFPINISK